MTDTSAYTPPEVWVWEKEDTPNWRYGHLNRPVAGATHEKELPRGKHPLQLYSLATPNGVKVTVMLEELLAAGHGGAEYDAWLIRIGEGHQFGSGFVGVNPNSKIPALLDYSERTPQRVFESGAILLYLADKFGAFLPKDRGKRTEALNWQKRWPHGKKSPPVKNAARAGEIKRPSARFIATTYCDTNSHSATRVRNRISAWKIFAIERCTNSDCRLG
jgi:glutathione S-transferase